MTPHDPNAEPTLTLQPMLHVADVGAHVAFFERLGGQLVYGSRDGDWALVRFGATELALLAHPANPDENAGNPLELQLASRAPLEDVLARLPAGGAWVARGIADEGFGRQLQLRSPDGLVIKVNEIDRTLVE